MYVDPLDGETFAVSDQGGGCRNLQTPGAETSLFSKSRVDHAPPLISAFAEIEIHCFADTTPNFCIRRNWNTFFHWHHPQFLHSQKLKYIFSMTPPPISAFAETGNTFFLLRPPLISAFAQTETHFFTDTTPIKPSILWENRAIFVLVLHALDKLFNLAHKNASLSLVILKTV